MPATKNKQELELAKQVAQELKYKPDHYQDRHNAFGNALNKAYERYRFGMEDQKNFSTIWHKRNK